MLSILLSNDNVKNSPWWRWEGFLTMFLALIKQNCNFLDGRLSFTDHICCPWQRNFQLEILQDPNQTEMHLVKLTLTLYCAFAESGEDGWASTLMWRDQDIVIFMSDPRKPGSVNQLHLCVLGTNCVTSWNLEQVCLHVHLILTTLVIWLAWIVYATRLLAYKASCGRSIMGEVKPSPIEKDKRLKKEKISSEWEWVVIFLSKRSEEQTESKW